MSNSWNTSWNTVGDYTGLSGSGGNFSGSSGSSNRGGGFWSSVGENLPKIAKGVGAGADIYQSLAGDSEFGFDSSYIKESTKEIDKRSEQTLEDMFDVFNIAENVFGVKPADALQEYYQRYGDVIEEQFRRGSDLLYNFDPDFSNQRQRLSQDIDSAISQYSNLLSPDYMSTALNPPVVKTDPAAIYGSLDFSPEKGYNIANPLIGYSDPGSRTLIEGRSKAMDEFRQGLVGPMAKELMTYNV
jgi:hypothetical protein